MKLIASNQLTVTNLLERAETRRETFYKLTNEGALGNLVVESKLTKGWLNGNGNGQILGPDTKGERTTDFIQVVAEKTYTFQWWVTVSEGQKCWDAWQFYDSNKTPFGSRGGYGEYGSDGEQHGKRTITAPANACYIRLSYRSFGNGHMMFEAGAGSESFEPSFDDSLKKSNRNIMQRTDKPFIMGYGITNTAWDDDKKWAYLDLTDPNNNTAKASEILPQGQFYNFKPTKGMTYTQSILIDTDATFNPNGQPQNSWFTSQGHNTKRGYFEQLSDTTYRFWSTCTWQLEDIALRAFDWYGLHTVLDFRNSGTYLAFYKPKLETSEQPSDWVLAPEDLGWSSTAPVPTQQQRYLWKFEYVYYSDDSVEITQPVNISIAGADADTTGVTDAINQTNQTVAGLQSSVSQAQSDLATVSSNLTQARQNLESSIASVDTKAQAIETTLAQVQSTANANSQKTATLENDLDGLSARFSSLKIGGTNLYVESTASAGFLINDVNNESLGAQGATEKEMTSDFIPVTAGEQLVYQGWVTIPSGGGSWRAWQFYGENKKKVGGRYTNSGSAEIGAQHFEHVITVPANVKYIRISARTYQDGKLKLEHGNIPSDYSQNEADIESKVAEYKQTADQNYASLQSTVQALDGTVTANKATADQTAQGFSTRIESLETYKDSETTRANQYFESAKAETARQLTAEHTAIANDYVAKSTYTEDVSGIRNDLTATTTTANTTKTNLAAYQASNDQAVANLQSSLQTTDGNVSNLQTQINAVPGQITSAVSAVEGKIAGSLVGQNLYIESTSVKGFLPVTGGDSLGGQNAVRKEVTSDFIRVTENEKYVFQGWMTVPDGDSSWRAWQYYDVDKQPISNRQTPGFNVTTDEDNVSHFQHIITMPANVKYIRISARLFSDGKLKFEKGSVATDYALAPEDTATQISSLSSQIQQTADGMTLLATKTELNTAKSDLQSGISAATSKADNAQATADSNAQTISTHTTQISALNTGLQAKVSQSDFDSLSGRVTTAESNLTATANQLSSQISSVNERIPTSKDFKNLYVIANSSDGFLAYGSTNLGAANPVYRERTSDYIPVEEGKKYTFQVWATLTENQQGWRAWQFYNEDKSLNGGRTAGNYTSDYQCVQQTLTVPTNAKWMRVSARMYSDGKIMVEKGDEYHDYMLAPEDAISGAALTQAKSEIKQTTDAITASVSSVETKANTAQSTANTAVSKADAAQAGVNTLDSTTVKSASLNLDNNGFVTKVGKTINGNKFATMIAQDANNVKIIADEMQVTANMIVDGAVTAEKLNVSNLSAVNSNLGAIKGGSLLLQENKTAISSVDNWGTFNRPAHKQGLYMDNHGLASSGAIQRKNGSETTPTDMPLAVLQSGELRFLVVDYNDNLENVLHYGLSDPDYGAIRFEIDSELKRRLTMTSSGYLNFQATNYTNWQSTGVSGCEYMIQGRLVLVNYDVTFSSAGTHTIGSVPQEFVRKSLMLTAKGWSVIPRDKNAQLNPDGSLHILDAEANVNYRGTLVFSY